VTQLIIIAIYLSLLLGLGLFASRWFSGSSKDYMLASHSIGPFLLLMSIFGTTMTAFALVGSSGEAFKEGIGVYGMLASSSGIIHSLCFFLLGVKLWSWGKKYGYTTQIQFFRDRLENNTIGLVMFPILVGLIIPYLLIGVLASGSVLQNMTAGAFPGTFPHNVASLAGGIPPWLGSLVICGVVLVYVFFGGMRGTAWANAFQTIVFMVLGVVTFFVIATTLGKEALVYEAEKKKESENAAVAQVNPGETPITEASPDESADAVDDGAVDDAAIDVEGQSFGTYLSALMRQVGHEKKTRSHMSMMKFFTYMLIPLSVGMFPHLFQHWLTAKSASSFKLPVVAHPIFIMIVWVPCVLIGIWASAEFVYSTLPPPVQANPNAVLVFLVKSKTSALLAGFLTTGILAAIMSSLDSQFLCIGTMFTNDIVAHYKKDTKEGDANQVWIARGFIVLIVAITYGISLLGVKSVFAMGVWCFTGFAALSPIAFAAVYWRRLTAAGVYAAIFAVVISWSYFFYQADFGAHRVYSVEIGATTESVDFGTSGAVTMELVAVPLNGDDEVVVTILSKEFPEKKKDNKPVIKVDEKTMTIILNTREGLETDFAALNGALKYHGFVRGKLIDGEPKTRVPTEPQSIVLERTGNSMMPVAPIFLCSIIAMFLVSFVTKPPSDATLAKFFKM